MDPLTSVVCYIWSEIACAGGIGAGVASLAVILLGGAAILGKISWGTVLMVVFGIAIMFGSAMLAASFTGGVVPCGC
ncbi:MAG: TrbC/VirB2 family protein [Pirellulales bacterium]|nr:TrbC/VirB2 family protein [Pirellulales bacterium]